MDTATKTELDAAKNASKELIQKVAEATEDLMGNKIADKITSVGKTKSKQKKDKTNMRQEIYRAREKKQQIIDDVRFSTTQKWNTKKLHFKTSRCNI